MDKLKHSNKVTNKEVFELIGKKRTLLNNILGRKTNWTVHILWRNWLWRTDDWSERSRNMIWETEELKEEAEVQIDGNDSLSQETKEGV